MKHDRTTDSGTTASWQDAENMAALTNSERHLGHAIREGGGWAAYDATHAAEAGNGCRYLGLYGSLEEARFAIESSVSDACASHRQKFFVA
jgi:hypothetical protein